MIDLAREIEQKKARRRTRLLSVVVGLWAAGILGRLVQIQAIQHAEHRRQVTGQSRRLVPIPTERGTIFDRNGHILAHSVPSFSVVYRPSPDAPIEAKMAPVLEVAPVLGLGPKSLAQMRRQLEDGGKFVYLRRKVDPETARIVRDMNVRGLRIEDERRRTYPQGPLAAHVLGGVDPDEKGLAGIEFRYNKDLGGREGQRLVLRDARRREYNVEILSAPKPGLDIVLTLDRMIQYFAQRELERAMAEHQAEWGTVIVSAPATGEILAMASAPGYDPNAFAAAEPERRIDRSIRHLFDPGSTFKIVTAAAVLDHGLIAPGETLNCAAEAITVPGRSIRDHKPFGVLAFADVIVHSSNIGTIQAARRLGPDLLYRTIRDFGFGERTGIDLPAEAAGLVRPPDEWSRRSPDALSVGYEISVTAVQLLQAMNIIANRGEKVGLRLLKSVGGRPANPEPDGPDSRVVSPAAAEKLAEILVRAVEEGTGTGARLPGFRVAGKTGTSQLLDSRQGGYTSSRHLAAFVGFVPADRPAISILVVLSEPKNKNVYYGGLVAAPVFREIARNVLRYLGLHPQAGPPPGAITARSVLEARR
ncbi:MAG: penicillin-binding protein 2 [Candidatus Aminicenantes bacterium]|nr:penicillin-binding protein 2 [Candidatus Aminicenantes bacterium]